MANLASPRNLRMDSWSTPMSTTRHRPSSSAAASSSGHGWPFSGSHETPAATTGPTYDYTTEMERGPMPRSDDSWNTAPTYHFHSEMHQNHRVLHTQVFKQVDVGQEPNIQRQLMVTQINAAGTERLRRPEFFFQGIVGHVNNRWRYRINGWKEASHLANYWCRYFDIEEIPYASTEPHEQLTIHDASDPPEGDEPQDNDADDTSSMGHPGDQTPSVPSQLAPILYDALMQDPEVNAPILEILQAQPENQAESNLRLFTAKELAHLGSHLAITTNILARRANPDDNLSDISGELDRDIP